MVLMQFGRKSGSVADPSWHLRAVLLPDGRLAQHTWLSADGWRDEPIPGADELPGRFALPGFIDAHSHVSFGRGSDGPVPVDGPRAEANLERYARDGVAVVRDAGGAPNVVLALPTVAGRPHVVAAGRHLAPAGMYFAAVHDPVEPPDVVDIALNELAAGARWVKLVGDFPPASARALSASALPEPAYDLEVVRNLVNATHKADARIAVHTTTTLVADLVRLGVDSVEHGTALDPGTIGHMAARGTAWTPTLCAVLSCPEDAPEERRQRVAERRERLSELLPLAVRLGVPILTGSDVVG